MQFIISDETPSKREMKRCHEIMLEIFKEQIELVKYWGPEQMCVFYLEYLEIKYNYKIVLECERGFITINVKNQDGAIFSPRMIYPEARYYHYTDVDKDIYQLVQLTYKAIHMQEIKFVSAIT